MVNTVCLGFSYECSEFSQSWFYPWFLAMMKDFGGEDEGFCGKDYRFFGKDYGFFGEDYGLFYFVNIDIAY